jgi:DNA-binding transcriptional MocR family regulator
MMTTWDPDLSKFTGPKYLAIADAIAADMEGGQLRPGDQLPTHRELADRLGITVGTITRAYAEAARRGLVIGETGRGTFIKGGVIADHLSPEETDDSILDLSINIPPVAVGQAMAATLLTLSKRPNLSSLLSYQSAAGMERHRIAGADWVSRSGINARPEQILICSGALHAMAVVFSTLTEPGDTVFTEELTYPGMKNLAHLLRLRLQGLPMDEQGIRPDAFEEACQSSRAKLLYCIPTIHNPLGIIMPGARRQEIATIAKKYDIAIVEDDVHSFMLPAPPPPLSTFAPDQSYYIQSTSKSFAGGIRIGFLLAPERMVERLTTALRATVWMAVPLMAEVITEWIQDGTAMRLIEQKRVEAEARQELARRILGDLKFAAHPLSYHIWLSLPEAWRSDEFIEEAKRRGILVTPPGAFVPGRGEAPHAVRVCLGAARSRAQLEGALQVIKDILSSSPDPNLSIF